MSQTELPDQVWRFTLEFEIGTSLDEARTYAKLFCKRNHGRHVQFTFAGDCDTVYHYRQVIDEDVNA